MLVPEPVVAVAAGYYHTLALAESGNVWAWGTNDKGQLGVGSDISAASEPRLLKALQGGWWVGEHFSCRQQRWLLLCVMPGTYTNLHYSHWLRRKTFAILKQSSNQRAGSTRRPCRREGDKYSSWRGPLPCAHSTWGGV